MKVKIRGHKTRVSVVASDLAEQRKILANNLPRRKKLTRLPRLWAKIRGRG